MSNRLRREQLRTERARAATDAQLEAGRHADADLYYPGAGDVLLRLAWLPSFEPCLVWEVRSHDGALAAYRSHGRIPSEPFVFGHQRLTSDDASLRAALDRIGAAGLSLAPATADVAVADGETYVATVYSGFGTSCRISWVAGSEPFAWLATIHALMDLRSLLEATAAETNSPPPLSEVAHVHSHTTSVQLVRLTNGDFQVISSGDFGSLLCGPDYILAATPLADALQAVCNGDIVLRDANIFRRATGESWSGFVEIIPITELKGPDDLPRARLSATRAWHYTHGSLFVNGEVRRALLALALPDISFSPGFARFGGHQAY